MGGGRHKNGGGEKREIRRGFRLAAITSKHGGTSTSSHQGERVKRPRNGGVGQKVRTKGI